MTFRKMKEAPKKLANRDVTLTRDGKIVVRGLGPVGWYAKVLNRDGTRSYSGKMTVPTATGPRVVEVEEWGHPEFRADIRSWWEIAMEEGKVDR